MFHGSILVLTFRLKVVQSADAHMTALVNRVYRVTTRWDNVCPYLYDHAPIDIFAAIPNISDTKTTFEIDKISVDWDGCTDATPMFRIEDLTEGNQVPMAPLGEHVMRVMTVRPPTFSLMRPHLILQ
jgi:hypothetical protein